MLVNILPVKYMCKYTKINACFATHLDLHYQIFY
jgi:hypothetical protein